MKSFKFIFILLFVCITAGCSVHNNVRKVSFLDNLIEFSIPDTEEVVYEFTKFTESNIHLSVCAFDYSELHHFEKNSFSTRAMEIFYNSSDNKYKQLLEYLKDYNFSTNDFAIFSDYNGYGSSKKKICVNSSHKPLIKNGQIIGEQIFYMPSKKLPFSVEYDFIFATRNKLVNVSIFINVLGNDVLPYTDFIIENSDGYYWKSEKAKEEFYKLLESNKYSRLPENLQILRETKDLFLETLTINERGN